jgi:hypothetical protein
MMKKIGFGLFLISLIALALLDFKIFVCVGPMCVGMLFLVEANILETKYEKGN